MRALFSAALLSVALLALTLTHGVSAHYTAPSSASITIHTSGQGSTRVTLPDRRSSTGAPLAECTFTYTTNEGGVARKKEAAVVPVAESTPGRIDAAAVARALEGACVSSTADYWTYELCFGKHFKQYHGGDVYMLGRVQSATSIQDGHALMMDGGDICAALTPPKPRAVKMNFACRASAKVKKENLETRMHASQRSVLGGCCA